MGHDVATPMPRSGADVNAVIGGYLRDLAFAQSSKQKMFGYKRAAAAILTLDAPLTDLLGPGGTCQKSRGLAQVPRGSSERCWRTASHRRSSTPWNRVATARTSSVDVGFGTTFSAGPKFVVCCRTFP